MDADPLTLLVVHAHPDDEAMTTGGTLAKYSAEGVRTVLVTCTNGELGDLPGGTKPGEEGHDVEEVVAMRRRELEASCRHLGVSHLEMLGYHDSGMMGWETNDAPDCFWQMPVTDAAAPLVELINRYEPDVVVTYDDFGFYGHPDHIQAHRITVEALKSTGSNARLYYSAIRRSHLAEFAKRMADVGEEPPEIDDDRFGAADEDIAATIDCAEQAESKLAALRAHGSQGDNIIFLRFELPEFTELFGFEEFVLADGHEPSSEPVGDLFAGIRR